MNTGKRSINNRIHGNIRALHEQTKSGWTFEEIKDLMKMMALENGYPSKSFTYKKDNKVKYYKVARSLSGQPDNIATILNETIQCFADENNFWLIEYDEKEKPYRTIGGRTRNEMIEYISELRKNGKLAEAIELEKEVEEKDR